MHATGFLNTYRLQLYGSYTAFKDTRRLSLTNVWGRKGTEKAQDPHQDWCVHFRAFKMKPLQLPLPPGNVFLLFSPPHSSDENRHFREDWLFQLSQQLMREWNAFNIRFHFNTKGGCVAFQLDVHICHELTFKWSLFSFSKYVQC